MRYTNVFKNDIFVDFSITNFSLKFIIAELKKENIIYAAFAKFFQVNVQTISQHDIKY